MFDKSQKDPLDTVASIVRDSLGGPPTTGMGGGSAMERDAQENWKSVMSGRIDEARRVAVGWPEGQRFLDLVAAHIGRGANFVAVREGWGVVRR